MSSHSAIQPPRYTTRMLMLLGIASALSAWLLYHHVLVNYGNPTDPSICNLNETFNCDEVARSAYAEVLGIPVASWGLWYYIAAILIILLFAPAPTEDPAEKRGFADAMLFLSAFGLIPSLIMFGISWFLVGSICLFCSGLYLINFLLFLVTYFNAERTPEIGGSILQGATKLVQIPFGLGVYRNSFLKQLCLWGMLAAAAAILLKTPALLITHVFEPRQQALLSESAVRPLVAKWQNAIAADLPVVTEGTALEKDFVRGDLNAPLTIVEFADFQCPACQRASRRLKLLLKEYPGKVRLVFKNFPLDARCNPGMQSTHHEFACMAALMTRCAGMQQPEKFWEMHDELFSLSSWDAEVLDSLPAQIGIDEEQFNSCMNSDEVMARVSQDIQLGIQTQLSGTPSVFLNGKLIPYTELHMLKGMIGYILENKRY